MDQMAMVRRGFSRASTFAGRDSRQEFWPYCGAVVLVWTVVSNGLWLVAFFMTASSQPRDVQPFLLITIATTVTAIGLLSAAVTRRLHDRERHGAWASAPLVALATGLVLFAAFARLDAEDRSPGLFLAGFATNLIFFGLMLALLVQLALPGRSADDQVGPPPGGVTGRNH